VAEESYSLQPELRVSIAVAIPSCSASRFRSDVIFTRGWLEKVRAAFDCQRNRFLIAESSIALVFRFLSVPPAWRFARWQKISF
jgi:hypothetical protein